MTPKEELEKLTSLMLEQSMAMNQTVISINELMMAHGNEVVDDVMLAFKLAEAMEKEQTALLLVNSLLRLIKYSPRKEEPNDRAVV